MRRPLPLRLAFAVTIAVSLAACAKQTSTTTESTTTTPVSRTNPSDFPLYPGSAVVESAPVDYGAMLAIIKKNDPSAKVGGNYRGHEVILSTPATLPELRTWVGKLKSAPPLGFHVVASPSGFSAGSSAADANLVSGAYFETAGSKRVVFLLALDPKRIRAQLGPALDVVDKYTALPPMLRGPVDQQMKEQTGYSVSEMLDRHSPIGMVFATLKSMSSANQRAIVLIDETKAS